MIKEKSARYRKIAAVLCLCFCVQLMAPAETVFAKYTTGETETHNNATQSLGSYSTNGYWVTNLSDGGRFWVPVYKETQVEGDKTLTTNKLDMEYIQALAADPDNNINLDDFVNDSGQYEFYAEIEYKVVIDNEGNTETFVGKDEMLSAPDLWGGSWSSKTKKNITSEDNSICEGIYYYDVPPSPTPTSVPTPTPITDIEEDDVVVTITPIPTNKPTDIPVTEAPITMPPTPTPTAPPSSPTPAPTPAPKTYTYNNSYEYYKYYTSTNGHSISDITVNGKIADDTGSSVVSLANALSSEGTRTSYTVGTDTRGYEWYLIPSTTTTYISALGSEVYTATSVHPKTYNGHAVDSSSVRYINNLVYPDYVTAGGRRYYVTSIGGSGPYYYANAATLSSGTVSRDFGAISGSYSWKSGTNTCGFTYLLGSVGNGTITSEGYGVTRKYNYDTYVYNNTYITNYYVYNTTLTSIRIPAYCETVEDYAFHNCQALLVITGGDNLKTIGTNAFSVAEVPEFKRSYIYTPNYWAYVYYTTDRIYSYDDSYVANYMSELPSETMKKFESYVTIGDYMEFPSLPKLVTIGESAFEGRYHLKKVELSSKVETIHKNAFKDCTLDRITVPNEKTSVKGGYDTLGTKGPDVNFLTEIVTPSKSPAYPRMYGETYDDYYRVFQDAYIYYHPNGANPNEVKTELAEIEYKEASFGDTYIDIGEGCILWLGDDGYIYYAYIDDVGVLRGNMVTELRGYRFKTLNLSSLGGYYEAVTSTGIYCYIKATVEAVYEQKWEYGEYNEYFKYYKPSVSYFLMPDKGRCINITTETNNGITPQVLRATGADGRYHWYLNGKWVSETPWPEGVTITNVAFNSCAIEEFGQFYHYEYSQSSGSPCYQSFRTLYHNVILCSDGSIYTKRGIAYPWQQLEGTYDAISSQNNHYNGLYPVYVYKMKNDTYCYRYAIEYDAKYNSNTQTWEYVPKVGGYTEVTIESCTFSGPLVTATASIAEVAEVAEYSAGDMSRATSYIAGATTSHSHTPNGSGSDTYYSYHGETVDIYQDTVTKKLTWTYRYAQDNNTSDNNNYDREYSSEYPAGTGTFLAARFDVAQNSQYGGLQKHFTYYLGADGCIYSTYGEFSSVKTFKVSDVKLVEYYLLSAKLAPMKADSWSSYEATQSSSGGSGYSVGTNSASELINIIGMDADGHLWGGVFGYGEATLTQLSDKVFTKVFYKNVIESTEGRYSSECVKKSYARFYAIDTNKDVYKVDNLIYKEIRELHENNQGYTDPNTGQWVTTYTWNVTTVDTTYDAEEVIELIYMDYAYDVEKFLSYPIILMEGSRPGLLTTTDAVIDIYCGVEMVYHISQNKWFTKSGSEFTHWNTSADGTGINRMVGDKIVSQSYSTNWQDSAQDINLYAQWGPTVPLVNKTKTVYYDGNGGYGTMGPTAISSGTNSFKVLQNAFSKDGHTFAGYFTANADGTGTKYYPGKTATVTAEYIVLYAQWTPNTYTVQFAYDDFRVQPAWFFNSATVTYDRSFALPQEPQKKELVVDYDINTNSSMSTAASAKWQTARPFSEEYTTSRAKFIGWDKYYYRDGKYVNAWLRYDEFEEVSGLTNVKNDVVTMFPVWGGIDGYVLLPYATCNGYELYGWMDAPKYEDATDVADYIPENGGGLYLPKASETLYAWWEPMQYEITFVQTLDGKAPKTTGDTSVTMTFDAECPDVKAPTMERYVFMGYYTKPDGKGVQYYGSADQKTGKAGAYEGKRWQVYDGSVTTLYAYWVPDKAVVYHPNYSPVDADCPTMETTWLELDETGATLTPNAFTKTGYHFVSWNTEPDGSGTEYADGQYVENITTRIILYAQWEANQYIVQYAPDSFDKNPTIPEPGPGDVWTYDVEYTIETKPYEKYDYVAYDLNRGNKSTIPAMVTTLTDAHKKSIYQFAGWRLYLKTADGYTKLSNLYQEGEKVSNITPVDGNCYVLFPEWKPTSDGVTLPIAACKGYTFHGWTVEKRSDGNASASEVLTGTYVTTRDTTLYAYWTPNKYTVTFDWNFNWDEPGIDTKTNWTGNTKIVTFDAAYGELPAPTREGYEFMGWFMSEDAEGNGDGTQVTPATIVHTAQDHTLYAKWSVSYMENADAWFNTILGNVTPFVAEGPLSQLRMLELGDTLLNITITTDGYFDYMQINLPWRNPIVVEFEEGTYDKENDIWYLPSIDYIQLFGANATSQVRVSPGYKNENYLVSIDIYKKDGTVLMTYSANLIFVPYSVWKDEVHPGRMSKEEADAMMNGRN